MKWQYIIIIMPLLFACNINSDTGKSKEEISMNQAESIPQNYKNLVVKNGDIDAYKTLSIEYMDHKYPEEFLLYAMIMANKYDYPQAYFDVFTCLTDVYMSDLNKMDTITANLAINYLIKAYKWQHHQAKKIVDEYSIKYNEKKNKEQIVNIFE
jgi:hypothetical protein